MFTAIQPIIGVLLQVYLEGFQQAAQQNTVFAILVSIIVILFAVVIIVFKRYEDKNKEIKKLHMDQGILNMEQANKIDLIRKEHATKIDSIRTELVVKEEERTRLWRESEKETLNVLNGVNTVLEMSEKMKENDTKNIIEKLNTLQQSIELKK